MYTHLYIYIYIYRLNIWERGRKNREKGINECIERTKIRYSNTGDTKGGRWPIVERQDQRWLPRRCTDRVEEHLQCTLSLPRSISRVCVCFALVIWSMWDASVQQRRTIHHCEIFDRFMTKMIVVTHHISLQSDRYLKLKLCSPFLPYRYLLITFVYICIYNQ